MSTLLLLSLAAAETVSEAFPPPHGADRVPADAFGDYLAALPVADPARPVRTHDGRIVGHSARVIELDVVPGDLQQCADSAIRLRAEWARGQGQAVSFHATSGDPIPWARWQTGERPYVQGQNLAWRSSGLPGGGEKAWTAYLSAVFTWAGSASLDAYETERVTEPKPGDMAVVPGFPGHVVVLLDVARQGERTWVLVGEGFMPAQDFHVELGPHQGWWAWTDDGLRLDHWHLPADSLRRWKGD